MSRTQEKELTIGTKQALGGDKKRRGLIGVCTPWLSHPWQLGAVRQRTESYCNSDYTINDQYFFVINLFTWIQNSFLAISLL